MTATKILWGQILVVFAIVLATMWPVTAVVRALQAATETQGVSETAIIEAALERFLSPKPQCDEENKLPRRFESMRHQLEQIERDLRLVNEPSPCTRDII